MQPARIEPDDHGRERLQDPNAAEKLKLYRVFLGDEDDERQRAEFDQQGGDLSDRRFLFATAASRKT